MVLLLDFGVDEVAVLRQFTDQRIDLTERQLRPALEITADEAVFVDAEFQCGGTGILNGSDAELLCKRQHAENATNASFSLMTMDRVAECADVRSGAGGTRQQLSRRERRLLGIVFRVNAMPAALLPDVLAQKLMCFRIENADVKRIPLDLNELSNPTRRNAVVGRVYLDTSIQMHGAFTVLVIAKRL